MRVGTGNRTNCVKQFTDCHLNATTNKPSITMTCLKRASIFWVIFHLFFSRCTAGVVISTTNATSKVHALRPRRCIECSGHQPQNVDAVERVRIDAIKRTIVEKLRLSLPHGVARVDLPRLTEPLRRLQVAASEEDGNQDDFYGHTTHIAVTAHEGWHIFTQTTSM